MLSLLMGGMFDVIIDAFKAIWDWFLSVLTGFASWVMGKLFALLPATDSAQLSNAKGTIAFAVSAANAWVPIDLIITLAGLYVAFVLAYLGVKVLVKMIP